MGIVEDAIHDWRPDASISAVEEPDAGLGLDGDIRLVTLAEQTVAVHVREDDAAGIDPAVKRVVGARTDVPVPRILHEGVVDGRAYHVEERLPGASLQHRFVALPVEQQERVLHQVGGMIGDVHEAVRFDASGWLGRDDGVAVTGRMAWPDLLQAVVDEELAGVQETRFADLLPDIRDAVERGMAAVPRDVDAVLLHNDLGPSNVLGTGARVTGIVDWANAVAGDSAYDLVRAERSFIDKRMDTARDGLRAALYDGYRENRDVAVSDRKRDVYRLACTLEVLRWFPVWSAPMDDDAADERARFWRGFIGQVCASI